MGRARVRITGELLLSWMPFPPTTSVVGSMNRGGGEIEIVVEDPALPTKESVPLANPTFRGVEPVQFVEWGLED